MPNNKSHKLMPNNNEKRDYNTGVSNGIKSFEKFFNGSTMMI